MSVFTHKQRKATPWSAHTSGAFLFKETMKDEELKIHYFPHDTTSSSDPKMIDLRISFGWKAIGMYWAIIEALHRQKNGMISKRMMSSMILDFYNQEDSAICLVKN